MDSETSLSTERGAPSARARSQGFLDDFETALVRLRAAFLDLLHSVPGLPDRPLALARHLGLDKNLGWKIVHVAHAADLSEALRHLPGPTGLRRFVDACAASGAGVVELAGVRAAIVRFDRTVGRHTGDRATLELCLASGGAPADAPRMEEARKRAFQGQSAISGVQARVRFELQIVAPSRTEPGRVDVAAVGGLADLRRLRASAACPLLSVARYGVGAGAQEPLEDSPDGLPLLRGFCSHPLPEIRAVEEPGVSLYELSPGPIGDTAAATCTFGWISRGLRGPADGEAELLLAVETPAEALVFDLLVHRDLALPGRPRLAAWSTMHGPPRFPLVRHARYALPLCEELEELDALDHPLLPRHAELARVASERAGVRLEELHGTRLTLRYPPVPSVIAQILPV